MQELTPLYRDVKKVISFHGRFSVQLELPPSSTLTESDIQKILWMSSWKEDINHWALGHEGLRGVKIAREKPLTKEGIKLEALVIGGIGYQTIPELDTKGRCGSFVTSGFHPPSSANFMQFMNHARLMATARWENGREMESRPTYRATGTYTFPELKRTLDNTRYVSTIPLTQMVVPHVEAYGRYLDRGLSNRDGNFGFIVLPIPSIYKVRFTDELLIVSKHMKEKEPENAETFFLKGILFSAKQLSRGLRQLHDFGMAHLQTHPQNYYFVKNTPYLMDWTTAIHLGTIYEDNIGNRALDICMSVERLFHLYELVFPDTPKEIRDSYQISAIYKALRAYDHKPSSTKESLIDFLCQMDSCPRNSWDFVLNYLRENKIGRFNFAPLAVGFCRYLKEMYRPEELKKVLTGGLIQ